jgi:Zn-dependent metalloprotease
MEGAVRQRCASLALSSLVIVTLSLSSFSFAACDRAKQQQALAALALRARIELDQNRIPSWIVGQIGPRTSEDPIQAAIDTLRTNADVFCASTTDNFVSTGGIEKEDKLGQTHVRINQTYRELDVVNAGLTVHMTRDSVILINGKFVPAIDLPTEPVLSRQEASRVALGHVTATGGTEGAVQGIRATVVFVDSHDNVYLAYPVKVGYVFPVGNRYTKGPHVDEFFVDAIGGTVVGSQPLMIRD